MSDKILFLGPDTNLSLVEKKLYGYKVIFANTETDAYSALPDVIAILDAYMKIPFPKATLENAQLLKIIVTATTGANHIDEAYLKTRNIPLLTLKGQEHITRNITAAAELSWMLMMGIARQIRPSIAEVLNGEWDRNKFPGAMLRGKTLGIIGCGRIGEWMSVYANAFGMNVLGFDPYKKELASTIQPATFDEVLGKADFISVHVPLNNETSGLMNREALLKLKKGAILINTSRGEIIDEDSLLELLENGHLAGAGLDVLKGEPYISNHPLVQYARRKENLIITPHIGGFSPDALNIVIDFSCQRIIDFFSANGR